jgi:hypothetical protein
MQSAIAIATCQTLKQQNPCKNYREPLEKYIKIRRGQASNHMLYRGPGGDSAAGDTLINGFLFSLNNRLESQRGGAQNTPFRAAIQRRGSILAWIVILSVYGADTIAIDLPLSSLIS